MLNEFRSQKITWDKANNNVYEKIEAHAGDSNGRKLVVQVINSGVVEDLTGASLSLAWKGRDNVGLDAFTDVDLEKGLFEIYYTTEMLANVGILKASLVLIDVNGRIESKSFDIHVNKSNVDDEAVESDNSFTALTQALVKVNDFDNRLINTNKRIDSEINGVNNKIDSEISTTNKRIDNIISTPTEISEQEIIDARYDMVDDVLYDSLGARLNQERLDYSELKGVNDGVVTPNKTSFITISSNLIDETSFKLGFSFDSSTGEEIENEIFALSDFIQVEPNSTIIFALGVLKIGRFDENKNFISLGPAPNTPMNTGSAHYVRVVVYKKDLGKGLLQLNKGGTLLPYEPYYKKLSGISIDKEQVIGLDTYTPEENKNLWEVDRYIISNETTELFTSSSIPSTGRDFHTMDTFLALYDDLMARFPHYITKTTLGQDSLGNNLYRYDFRPQEVPDVMVNNIKHKDKTPKMILISGIHGMERAGAYNLFEALRQITEDWQEDGVLEMLRWNTHFIVVPIANPYGFENLIRQNENGVDLARNFPAEWEKNNAEIGDNTYQGPAPLSEKSSQIIANLIESNKDAIYFGSFHNYGGNNPDFIWNAGATKMQVDMGKTLVSMLSRKWRKTYEWLPQDETTYFGHSNSFAPPGSEGVYAAHLGIQASTFETSDNMFYEVQGEPYSALSLTLGTETIVNWLALNLRENVKYYNSI